MESYQQALQMSQEMDYAMCIADVNGYIGLLHAKEMKTDEALKWLKQSEEIYIKHGYKTLEFRKVQDKIAQISQNSK